MRHAHEHGSLTTLRDLVDEITDALRRRPVSDNALAALRSAGMPGSSRYELIGPDWSYMPEPMGEDFDYNANCNDASAGPAQNQIAAMSLGSSSWSDAGAAFGFTSGSATNSTSDALNGDNVIFFCPAGSCGLAPTTVAATRIWFVGDDIVEWDIVFNDQNFVFWDGQTGACHLPGEYDTQSVAAHEFGHALGMAHSLNSSATMWQSIPPCETCSRSLHADDIDGLLVVVDDDGRVTLDDLVHLLQATHAD